VRGRSIHLPPLALTLARRGRFEDALDLVPLVPRSVNSGVTLRRCARSWRRASAGTRPRDW
jgi:hypothetical protein